MPTEVDAQLQEAEITIEFEDAREEALIREAVMGLEADDFLHSDLGRFVVGSAVQDQQEIEAKLARVNPHSIFGRRKIAKLQQEHRAVQMAVSWLTDCVRVGKVAQRELEAPVE